MLGAEVADVPPGNSMAPRNWRLVAADDQRIDYFLVRDADSRLSERESHLRWGTFLPNLATLGLSVIELFRMYATDGQTDGQTNKRNAYCPFPIRSGHNNHTTLSFMLAASIGVYNLHIL